MIRQGAELSEPGEQCQDRILLRQDEDQDDDQSKDGLAERADMGTEVLGVGAAEPLRDEPFAAERVEVSGHGVVKGQERCEHARDEQQGHDRRQHRSDIGLAKGEQERGRVRLQAAEVFLKTDGALAFHHQIRGHRVEDADGQDGDIGCPRDGTRRVLGLLAVNGGGLESDERREVEQQCDRDRAAGERRPR